MDIPLSICTLHLKYSALMNFTSIRMKISIINTIKLKLSIYKSKHSTVCSFPQVTETLQNFRNQENLLPHIIETQRKFRFQGKLFKCHLNQRLDGYLLGLKSFSRICTSCFHFTVHWLGLGHISILGPVTS